MNMMLMLMHETCHYHLGGHHAQGDIDSSADIGTSDLGTVIPGGSIKLGVAIACKCIVTSHRHGRSFPDRHLSKSTNINIQLSNDPLLKGRLHMGSGDKQ